MTNAAAPISGNGKLVPIPPDGGWGWAVVVGSFFIHVFADGFVYSFGVLVNELMREFDANNAMAALIISLLTGLTLGCGPLASAVCNKYGCRNTVFLGAAISFIGCAASYFATSIYFIVVSVGVVMGCGFGLMYCPAIVIVTMYFEKRRSLATGIAVAGAGVGTVLFSPINAYAINNFGWRSVFLVFLFILILCALCGATFRPLEFVLVSDDGQPIDEAVEAAPKVAEVHNTEEKAALLSPPGNAELLRSMSQTSDKSNKSGHAAIRPAHSLNQFVSSDGEIASPRTRSRCGTLGEKDSGYVNRKDVFYTGSIQNVAEFREDPDKYRSTGSLHKHRHTTIGSMSAHSIQKIDEVRETSEESNETTENNEGRSMFKTINNMLSLSLLLDSKFLLFAISNLLTSVGFNSPLYFLPLHATAIGLTLDQGAKAMSVFGFCNTFGRIVFGLVADHELPLPYGLGKDPVRNRLWLYNLSLTMCGILTIFCFLFGGFYALCIYAGLFGFTIASYICLTSVILVDLLGLDKLTNAFGLLLLWQGVGTVFGPPISGWLADLSGNYTFSFVFCGINLLISGLMLFALPFLSKKEKSKAIECGATKSAINGH